MMKDDESTDISAIRLMLGYLCVAKEAEASVVRKVEILDRFKLATAEIAAICGCGVQAVLNARHMLKKTAHGKKKKK
jgi:hypothetical protein